MEKELKIVLSAFLAFFIYALTTFFDSGTFLAPFFLAKLTMVLVALIIAAMNLRTRVAGADPGIHLADFPERKFMVTPKAWVLWLYFISTLFFALTDELTVQLLDYWTKGSGFNALASSPALLLFTFFFCAGFYVYSVILFYTSVGKTAVTVIFAALLALFIFGLFMDLTVLRTLSIDLFFILFFLFTRRDSHLKNKALRCLGYQYLLIPLLQSFEYFV